MKVAGQVDVDSSKATRRDRISHLFAFFLAGVFLCLLITVIFTGKQNRWIVFGTYWESGRAAAERLDPYTSYPLTHIDHGIKNHEIYPVVDLNLNPPCFLPLLQWLAHLDLRHFGIVWISSAAFFFVTSVVLLICFAPQLQMRQILWISLCAPVFDTFLGGQIYFLLLFFATLTVVCAENNLEVLAGICLGLLVAIKPTIAFWPALLFINRRFHIASTSVIAAAVVSSLPVFLYGKTIYRLWLNAIISDNHWMIATDIALPAFFRRLGMPSFGYLVAAGLFAVLSYFVWKYKFSFIGTSGLGLCAMLLCSPLAWYDYIILLFPVLLWRSWGRLETIAAILLMVPTAAMLRIARTGIPLAIATVSGIYLAAIVLILYSLMQREVRRAGQKKGSAEKAVEFKG